LCWTCSARACRAGACVGAENEGAIVRCIESDEMGGVAVMVAGGDVVFVCEGAL